MRRRRRPPRRGARARRARRRRADRVRRARAHRHAARGRLLPPRRHPAVRPAQAARRDERPARDTPSESHADARGSPVLLDLLAARGPSGYESAPAAVWREAAGAFAEVSTDVVGTPLALVAPKHGCRVSARRLLVMGHIDEIGLIVTHIDDEGYLWFRDVGGWDAQILVGQRVVLDTREGPVTRRRRQEADPPAARRGAQEGRRDPRDAHRHRRARRRARRAGCVRIGDVAVIDAAAGRAAQRPARLARAGQPPRLLRRARGGAPRRRGRRRAVGARGGRRRAGGDHLRRLAHERLRARARRGDRRRRHARDRRARASTSRRPASTSSARGRCSAAARRSTSGCSSCCYETAEAEKIPFTVEATARATGTDADAVHLSRGGVPTALVSIPMRYMHSPVELVQLDDVDACARLIAAGGAAARARDRVRALNSRIARRAAIWPNASWRVLSRFTDRDMEGGKPMEWRSARRATALSVVGVLLLLAGLCAVAGTAMAEGITNSGDDLRDRLVSRQNRRSRPSSSAAAPSGSCGRRPSKAQVYAQPLLVERRRCSSRPRTTRSTASIRPPAR